MVKNKRGLSAIVVTLLIILLVFVAVAIVWNIVRGILEGGADQIEYNAKCLDVDVKAVSVTCPTADACAVKLERTGSGTDDIAGVKLVFADSVNSERSAEAIEVSGNIAALVGKTETVNSGVTAPDSIEVTTFFEDESGNEHLCSQTNKFNF